MNPYDLRIGLGFDLHRLEEGRECKLAGVVLPHDRGPAGHSDGDAVLHALCDGLTGAAGIDDLGSLFPDTDAAHKNQDSAEFVAVVMAALKEKGWAVVNVDIVIATEGPRIAPHRTAMRARLAELLQVPSDRVNIKGKSLEGMGALAGGTGVAVQAVCLLTRTQEG